MNEKYKQYITANACGTVVAEIVTIPICTIKTNYQTGNFKTVRETTKYIYKTNGIKGYFNASYSAIISQLVSSTSKFTFYKILKEKRKTADTDIKNNMLNGCISGVSGGFLAHPFDVVKNYQQRGEAITNGLNKYGPNMFYHGFSQTIGKNIALYSILFPTYDYYKSLLKETKPLIANIDNASILAAPMTTLTTALILQPIDFLKVRMMANKSISLGWNPLTYYKGLSLHVMRALPHFTITMVITDYILKR
jgi:hypothetical protein